MNLIKSGFKVSQKSLMKLKFSPSGPGLLSPPQSYTVDLFSSSENLATRLSFSLLGREGKCTPSRVGLLIFGSANLLLK